MNFKGKNHGYETLVVIAFLIQIECRRNKKWVIKNKNLCWLNIEETNRQPGTHTNYSYVTILYSHGISNFLLLSTTQISLNEGRAGMAQKVRAHNMPHNQFWV